MNQHYRAIAEYYDHEYASSKMLQKDIPFFLKQLPKKSLRVLDLCCGTARSSIPIAQAGHCVVGVDFAQDMLDIAKRKRDFVGLSARELDLICQNALKLRISERFDWACIFFNTFLTFSTLEQQDAVLQGVRKHLRANGKLWLDIFQPNLEMLAEVESKKCDPSIFYVPSLDRSIQRTADIRRDRSRQTQRITFHYHWFTKSGVAKHEQRGFEMTSVFPRELQLLLERNGFVIEKIFGDYDGSALNVDSPRMIALARRR